MSVGIVGAGRIGTGLLHVFVEHGIDTAAVDVGDAWDGLHGRSIIVEALPEELDLKRSVLREVQQRLNPVAVLSTTSSLTAAALAADMPAPDRILLWHPFNPVAHRRLVEIAEASGPRGNDARQAHAAAVALAHTAGREVLEVRDSPGLVVNRILKRWTHAGLMALDDGWSAESIDAAFVEAGFRMGPVSVVRLVGPAVSLAVSRNLTTGLGSRFEPPGLLVAAAADPRLLDRPGRSGDASQVVTAALAEVREEIERVLDEQLVRDGATAVRMALREGAGWTTSVLQQLHSW